MGTVAFFFRRYAAAIHPGGFVTQGCSLDSVNTLLDICTHASDLLKQRFRQAKHRCGSLRAQGLLAFPEVKTALGRSHAGGFQDGFGLWVTDSEAIGCAFLLLTDGEQVISARRLERWRTMTTYIRAGLRQRLHPPSLHLLREPARASQQCAASQPSQGRLVPAYAHAQPQPHELAEQLEGRCGLWQSPPRLPDYHEKPAAHHRR